MDSWEEQCQVYILCSGADYCPLVLYIELPLIWRQFHCQIYIIAHAFKQNTMLLQMHHNYMHGFTNLI